MGRYEVEPGILWGTGGRIINKHKIFEEMSIWII